MKRDWLWAYSPFAAEFFELSSFNRCVYHCVDEIKVQPAMPAEAIERAEEELTRRADIVFTTSPQLTETRRRWNACTHYLPNVADYEHFSSALAPQTRVPSDLEVINTPRLGFIGAVSGYKIDFRLIRRIAETHPEWSIVLVGSIGEGDPWTDARELQGLANLHLLGPRPYRELPAYLKGFDVALLPNQINEYTDSMFPMKFFEYLAAGRPIVSVDLKALRAYADVISIADSNEDFISRIVRALAGDVPPLKRRLDLAQKHTYAERTRKMLALIDETCG